MANSDVNKALLLVGESLTKMTNSKDKSVAMLFGDGGGAILLEKTEENSSIKGILKTDGSGYKSIIAPAGGFRNLNATTESFTWPDGNVRTLYNTIMQGEDVFAFTIRLFHVPSRSFGLRPEQQLRIMIVWLSIRQTNLLVKCFARN